MTDDERRIRSNRFWFGWTCGLVFCVVLFWPALRERANRFTTALAQEKPPRETRTWHLAMLPKASDTEGYYPVRVDVLDTEGVCLYVARGWSLSDKVSPAMVAVPKTQLPPGAGCQ